jgi:amino acid transporter
MVAFMITGLLAACVGLCYAELASAVPVSGSAYSYTYVAIGEGAAMDHGRSAGFRIWFGCLYSRRRLVGLSYEPAYRYGLADTPCVDFGARRPR